MAIKSYVFNQTYKAPYVVATGLAHNPQEIKLKKFRKGEIIKGELKHANNKPAFVLVGESLVIPLFALKELHTKDIANSGADGSGTTEESKPKRMMKIKKANVSYIDGLLLGTALGFGGMILAEKQGWVERGEGNRNRLYGAIGGAVLGAYIVYRMKKAKPKTQTSETVETKETEE